MPNRVLRINLFSKFEILLNGEAVLMPLLQSRKMLLFVQYLLLRRERPVPHDELVDVLWADSEISNPGTALRTMLHRFRAMVNECGIAELDNCIITGRSTYQWNPELACSVDMFEFEDLAFSTFEEKLSPSERIKRYRRIIDIYTGPLLPSSASELWVTPKAVRCHDAYLECVFAYIELLKTDENYAEIVQVCRRAMDIELYDERLHMELMMALVKTGKSHDALSQYYFVTDLQYKQLGLQPSDAIRSMYKLILQANQQMKNDIDSIQESIVLEDDSAGAFVCEYEIFKEIYQLQRRMLERYNSTMFLGLVTLSSTYEQNFDPLVLDSIMRRLLELTVHSLRRGDTVSRFSAAQLVLLLPNVTYETGTLVMERLKKSFYSEYVKSSVILSYKLRPLNVK